MRVPLDYNLLAFSGPVRPPRGRDLGLEGADCVRSCMISSSSDWIFVLLPRSFPTSLFQTPIGHAFYWPYALLAQVFGVSAARRPGLAAQE